MLLLKLVIATINAQSNEATVSAENDWDKMAASYP